MKTSDKLLIGYVTFIIVMMVIANLTFKSQVYKLQNNQKQTIELHSGSDSISIQVQ